MEWRSNWKLSRHCFENQECYSHHGARGKISGSSKSSVLILLEPWMSLVQSNVSMWTKVGDRLTYGVASNGVYQSSVYHSFVTVWLWWLDAQHSHLPTTSSTNHKGDNKWGHDAADIPWCQNHGYGIVCIVATQQEVHWLCKCPSL